MSVLLDVVDPDKKKKLDDGAEPRDIWRDDNDDDDVGVLEGEKGVVVMFCCCTCCHVAD